MAIMTAAAQRTYWRAELRARLLDDEHGTDDVLPITPGGRNRAELLALLDDADQARIPPGGHVDVEYVPRYGWRVNGQLWAQPEVTAHDAATKCTHHTRSAAIWQEISSRVEAAKRQERVEDLAQVFARAAGFVPTNSDQKVTTNMLHAGVRAVLDELGVEAE